MFINYNGGLQKPFVFCFSISYFLQSISGFIFQTACLISYKLHCSAHKDCINWSTQEIDRNKQKNVIGYHFGWIPNQLTAGWVLGGGGGRGVGWSCCYITHKITLVLESTTSTCL